MPKIYKVEKTTIYVVMETDKRKTEIMKVLEDSPLGLSINEIASEIKVHRNTVSKLLEIMEEGDLVTKKQISRAKVFFSKKRNHLDRKLIASLFQAFFMGIKEELPNKEIIFKKVGGRVLDHFQFPLGEPVIMEFPNIKKYEPIELLKLFQEFYNAIDILQDEIDISIRELNQSKVVYRLKNSEFLGPSGEFNYFYYVISGMVESVYKKYFHKKVSCNVVDIHNSDNKEESFVDISLELI
jgi:DNA-binding transcriptional regulator YhcF (GntR family)